MTIVNESLEHGEASKSYSRKLAISASVLFAYVILVMSIVGVVRILLNLNPCWHILAIVAASSFLAGFGSIFLTLLVRASYGATPSGGMIGMLPRDGVPLLSLFIFICLGGVSGKIGASFVLIFFLATLPLNVWMILPEKDKISKKLNNDKDSRGQ